MNHRKITNLVLFTTLLSISAFAQLLSPQGRLSLSSTNAVMTADVTAATTIYYVPYPGTLIPIKYQGAWGNRAASVPLTLTLNSSQQTSGNIYDIFAFVSAGNGAIGLGVGPAWTVGGGSSTSRGSGSGSTAIQQDSTAGVWVNTNAIIAYNGTNWWNPNPGNATYLGSVYMTGNGATTVNIKPTAASGGTDNVIGIWNAYNRVPLYSLNRDSNTSWTETVSGGGWQKADTSSGNQITWVDGLQQTSVRARFATIALTDTNASTGYLGINLDSTTATPNLVSGMLLGTAINWDSYLSVEETFPPQMGLHYVQAMQDAGGASTATITFIGIAGLGVETFTLQSEY